MKEENLEKKLEKEKIKNKGCNKIYGFYQYLKKKIDEWAESYSTIMEETRKYRGEKYRRRLSEEDSLEE